MVGPTMCMHEYDNVRQGVIVVDDVRQIYHHLMSFVLRWMERRQWIVSDINCRIDIWQLVKNPGIVVGSPGCNRDDGEESAESSDSCVRKMEPSRPGIDQADGSKGFSSCLPTLCMLSEDCSVLSLLSNETKPMMVAIETNLMKFFDGDIPRRPRTLKSWRTTKSGRFTIG